MNTLPGAECARRLVLLRERLVSGIYVGPILGIVSNRDANHPFEIRYADDIEVLERPTPDSVPVVRIRGRTGEDILVDPANPHTLKIGKDSRGKPIFLSELE